ncbi:MAG: dephospho-CoA kinase [Rhodospirillales bacterium]|jgi:dephospho-CoA kinase|nr:dephospho-CoA kinase [Rhodospirillales bacterium]MDP6884947.1 dephospho-CoA kinase [Rhodospirillales bacterium]
MVILGLTGSIGMGKSTAARVFRRMGLAVHDADRAVHDLLATDQGAIGAVAAAFPEVRRDAAIDRQALARKVFDDEAALARLEAILHPLVRRRQDQFLRLAARARRPVVVLDVPLLFETGGERQCDAVVVVSAPAFVQAQRVLRRPTMTRRRLDAILERQQSDAQKRRRADFLVDTGLGRRHSLCQLRAIVKVTSQWRGDHWPPRAPRRYH